MYVHYTCCVYTALIYNSPTQVYTNILYTYQLYYHGSRRSVIYWLRIRITITRGGNRRVIVSVSLAHYIIYFTRPLSAVRGTKTPIVRIIPTQYCMSSLNQLAFVTEYCFCRSCSSGIYYEVPAVRTPAVHVQ